MVKLVTQQRFRELSCDIRGVAFFNVEIHLPFKRPGMMPLADLLQIQMTAKYFHR